MGVLKHRKMAATTRVLVVLGAAVDRPLFVSGAALSGYPTLCQPYCLGVNKIHLETLL